MRTILLAASAALIALAAPAAQAAAPATGEVSAEHLTQSWSGTATSQPMNNSTATQSHRLCIAPFCDTFTLTVKDAGHLKVRFDAPGSAGFVDVLITKPDGTKERLSGNETDTFQEIAYKNAANGPYTFDIWTNEIYGLDDGQYSAGAELCTLPFGQCFVPPPVEEEDF